MKFNDKSNKIILLLITIVSLLLLPRIMINFNLKETIIDSQYDNTTPNYPEAKSSQVHIITGNIEIDDLDPLKNWSYTLATYDWLTQGDGSETTPYELNELWVQNPPWGENCITIRNSKAYFRIENSICTNAINYNGAYGILLDNVTNGRIVQNTCSDNTVGIKLLNSYENWIAGNDINFNDDGGIILENSNNNTFYDNNLNSNYDYSYGIYVEGDNNVLLENRANNIPRGTGIIIHGDDNEISQNEANNNDYGIRVGGGNNSIILNTVMNNRYSGIRLGWPSYYNLVYKNTAVNNTDGISLTETSIDNNITENIVNKNEYGIDLENTNEFNTINNNTISKNSLNLNFICGIRMINVEYNNITDNTMNYCGIYLDGSVSKIAKNYISNTNIINGKTIYFYNNQINLYDIDFSNAGQIILVNCLDSEFSYKDVSHGSIGISLFNCTNIYISDIESSNNTIYGFYVNGGSQNTILNSICNENGDAGIVINSENCTIEGNEANFNNYLYSYSEFGKGCGIYFEGSFECKILDNYAFHNIIHGISLNGVSNSIISGNSLDFNNGSGLYLDGISGSYVLENTINFNLINGIHIIGTNNTIRSNIITNHYATAFYTTEKNGILLESSHNNRILNNHFITNSRGLQIWSNSGSNVVRNNYFSSCSFAVYISYGSSYNTNSDNNIDDCYKAFHLYESDYNSILSNNIVGAGVGVDLSDSNHNNISDNSIGLSQGLGINLYSSNYNRITRNTITGFHSGYCIVEESGCIGNIFENNVCKQPVANVPGYNLLIIIGLVSLSIVIVIREIIKKK